MFHRTLLCLLPACLALLAACSEPFDFRQSRGATNPKHAYTWQEWVARETPTGPDFVPYAHRQVGPPNVEAWTPEDFLPEEYLKEKHADICELPQEEREKVRIMAYPPTDKERMAERLAYAKRGYAEAQSGLGWYCLASNREVRGDPALGFTAEDALEWARRGAAGGSPEAMHLLGTCMYLLQGELRDRDPFWEDQAYFWLWRAVSESLHDDAVFDIRPGVRPSYSYPTYGDRAINDYTWSRLWEIQAIFRRAPYFLGRHYMEGHVGLERQKAKLSPMQLEAGEAAVRRWLYAHPDIWDKIYRRPLFPAWAGVYCPGEAGHRNGLDYEELNRELARYGLQAAPPAH